MEKEEKCIQLAAMDRLLRKHGAIRVSEKGKLALRNSLERIGDQIAVKSVKFAEHAGRNTVKEEDVKLALKLFEE